MQDDRRLQLVVTPLAAVGHDIAAVITATNVPETVLTVHAPDTVVIEGPKKEVVGVGSFQRTLHWRVIHVQRGHRSLIEFQLSAGPLVQTALCKIL